MWILSWDEDGSTSTRKHFFALFFRRFNSRFLTENSITLWGNCTLWFCFGLIYCFSKERFGKSAFVVWKYHIFSRNTVRHNILTTLVAMNWSRSRDRSKLWHRSPTHTAQNPHNITKNPTNNPRNSHEIQTPTIIQLTKYQKSH